MAKQKPTSTKTQGPIHFEDLDPHIFEDLVRELIYDFRDWQTIEGFDGIPAVEDISFEIPEGSLFTLRGPRKNLLLGTGFTEGTRDAVFSQEFWSGR